MLNKTSPGSMQAWLSFWVIRYPGGVVLGGSKQRANELERERIKASMQKDKEQNGGNESERDR